MGRESSFHEKVTHEVVALFKDLEVTLARPADGDAVIQRAIDHGDPLLPDEGTPYYCEVWPAAPGLARWLVEEMRAGRLEKGQRVLEVGCGLGLVGLALAKEGARVVLTDGSPAALELVHASLEKNRPFFHEPVVALLDWRSPEEGLRLAGAPFPWIVGADVLYSEESFAALAKTAAAALAPGGTLWIAEPRRPVAKLAGDHFLREGFRLVSKLELREAIIVSYTR